MQSVSLAVPHFEQEKTYSCVAACVRMVLKYYSFDFSEDEVRRRLITKPSGIPLFHVARVVSRWDLNVELGEFSFDELTSFIGSKFPPIIFLQTGSLDYWTGPDSSHAAVLTAVDAKAQTVEVNDPFFTTPQQTSVYILEAAWFRAGNLAAVLRQR